MPRGGKRPGAGRPKKVKPEAETPTNDYTLPNGEKSASAPPNWPFGTEAPALPKRQTAREYLSDLVNNTRADDKLRLDAAKRLIEFLRLPWDDKCVDFHKSDRPVKTASVAQVRKPIYKTSVQRWKKYGEGLQPLVDAIDGKPQAEKPAPKPKGKAKVKENA